MQRREVEILNKQGLNAPASAKLAQLASNYLSDVSVARSGRKVNAKSLMGVMMLAAGQGSRVVIETDGPDEDEAMNSGTRSRAPRKASRKRSRLSPTTVFRRTSMPILFSSSVRKREFVSRRSGVSNSEPTAMISAFTRRV